MKAEVVELPRSEKESPTLVLPRDFKKPKNKDVRTREYLTPDEVDALMRAAKKVGRHGHRDATLILLGFRHGLRVSELVSLRWDQVELNQGRLLVGGSPSVHPIRGL
jgi:type 1 fimbriae regulatory protein FimB/type 1 fimbriae regulatory protein FimE